MNAPRQRIELFRDPNDPDRIEILLLGDPLAIAELHVKIRAELERAGGAFHNIKPLVMAGAVLGWEAMLSVRAGVDDVIAAALGTFGVLADDIRTPFWRIDSEGRSAVATW